MEMGYSMAFGGIKGYLLVQIMHTSSYDNYSSVISLNDADGIDLAVKTSVDYMAPELKT